MFSQKFFVRLKIRERIFKQNASKLNPRSPAKAGVHDVTSCLHALQVKERGKVFNQPVGNIRIESRLFMDPRLRGEGRGMG